MYVIPIHVHYYVLFTFLIFFPRELQNSSQSEGLQPNEEQHDKNFFRAEPLRSLNTQPAMRSLRIQQVCLPF